MKARLQPIPTWQISAATLVVLAGLTVAAWVFVLGPDLSRSSQDAEARIDLAEVRSHAAESSRALAAVQTGVARARLELDTYNQPCWSDSDRSRRLEWLYRVSRAAGLKIEGVEPGEAETVSNRRGLSMRLNGRGDYASIQNALHDLRTAMPDVVLRHIELNALSNGTTASSAAEAAEITVSMELLWLPVATAADGPPPARGAAPRSAEASNSDTAGR